jgi:protein-disulfide isomerase
MRLTEMKIVRSLLVVASIAAFGIAGLGGFASAAVAQRVVGSEPGTPFKDTSIFRPPVGARVAVIEFQDLMCPLCAHVFPIMHGAVEHYNIPLVAKDFPLPGHAILGSFEAAVWARYLQDKVSMKVADEYRGAVFAGQAVIANKDDMQSFTRKFFQSHGIQIPFVADPSGELAKEVNADKAQGEKVGVAHTPTIIVCNQHEWVEVSDPSQLYTAIDQMEAGAGPSAAAKMSVKTAVKKKPAGQ